jgi:hypothetical protein
MKKRKKEGEEKKEKRINERKGRKWGSKRQKRK